MGSLLGHVVPGTAFSLIAIWWTFNFFFKFFKCSSSSNSPLLILHRSTEARQQQQQQHRSSRLQRRRCRRRFPPLEISIRIVVILIGMSGEFLTALDEHWRFQSIHNAQHMTMFGFFLLPTAFELLYVYSSTDLPASLDIVSASLAFAAEAVLFAWHLHGRAPMDAQAHTFLVYCAVACALSLVLEAFLPHDVRPCLLRACFTLLQGVWFFFVGIILYPPEGWTPWKQDDHEQMMLVTMMFTWCLVGVVGVQATLGVIAYCCSNRGRRNSGKVNMVDAEKSRGTGEYTSLAQTEEEETDDEELVN